MLYEKKGLPEENEIVLCKVTKLFPTSVFVDLLEYKKNGMVHITEIAAGRIRNLRDYVSVGRQIVCKVLRVKKDSGHIDLSLRRVNFHQRSQKLEEVKNELKAESLINNLAIKLKIPVGDLYSQIFESIYEDYDYIFESFMDVVENQYQIKLKDKEVLKELNDSILDKFKPELAEIVCEVNLKSYTSDGLNKIVKTLKEIESYSERVHYLGAGLYKIIIQDKDVKLAEKKFKSIEKILDSFDDKYSGSELKRK